MQSMSPLDLPLSHIWQPAGVESRRLLVVLHGLGDSASGFLWLQEELGFESLNLLLLNAPDPYYTGYSWYDIDNPQPGIERSREILTRIFDETRREGYASDHTFLLGFSQGCLMTLEFGSRYAAALAGYVGISGYVRSPEAILNEMNPLVNNGAWLVTHGLDDELLPVHLTRAQIQKLNAAG
ncbi:MAG TPA: serine esterase, partial [Terriglobia bacterium]|nr:serine esterase [Terriglobia bacterium]